MFRAKLEQEFAARRARNPRYSVRAFAAFLGADHSTLAQILRGVRPAPAASIRAWAKILGMSAEEAAVYIAAEHVPDAETAHRQHQLRHWTAEALSIITEPAHWEIIRRAARDGACPDTRAIAQEAGIPVDQVNIALARLMRLRLLGSVDSILTERQFRKLALARVREMAKD
jgi:transcriptional regulator with XRE-family HTH domain